MLLATRDLDRHDPMLTEMSVHSLSSSGRRKFHIITVVPWFTVSITNHDQVKSFVYHWLQIVPTATIAKPHFNQPSWSPRSASTLSEPLSLLRVSRAASCITNDGDLHVCSTDGTWHSAANITNGGIVDVARTFFVVVPRF